MQRLAPVLPVTRWSPFSEIVTVSKSAFVVTIFEEMAVVHLVELFL